MEGLIIKKPLLIVFITAAFIFSAVVYIKNQDRDKVINKEIQKTESLPTNYTLKMAINDGIVDVTNIHSEPNSKIEIFLTKIKHQKWATLKTIQETSDNDLMITDYFFDDHSKQIRVWQYLIKKQGGISPDNRFLSTYTTSENGVINLFLKNILSWPDQEKPSDELLYRYYDPK